MKTEIKIIKMMLRDCKEYTIRELSLLIHADYKITHTAVKSLIKKNILGERKAGNSFQVRLLMNFSNEVFEAEHQRREELFMNKNFKLIYNTLSELNFQFIGLIFGSYAKSKQTKNSDIDLMVISEKSNEKAVENALSIFSLGIHLIFLSYEEFLQMKNSKEFSVVSEALKNNIILFNIEDYYRLAKNVR